MQPVSTTGSRVERGHDGGLPLRGWQRRALVR